MTNSDKRAEGFVRRRLVMTIKDDTNTVYADIDHSKAAVKRLKDSNHRKKMDFLNGSLEVPPLDEDRLEKFCSLMASIDTNRNDSEAKSRGDSRSTGGGSDDIVKKKNTLTKKPSFESSISPVVSFKTKNPHRKPVHFTKKITVNSVADLAQKFNEKDKESGHKKGTLENQQKDYVKNFVEKYEKSQTKGYSNIIIMDRISKSEPKRKNSTRKSRSESRSDGISSDDNIDVKPVRRKPSFKTAGVVRATVRKFEPDSLTEAKENGDSKPRIPEKKQSVLRTKNLVLKDGKPKIKILRRSEMKQPVVDTSASENIVKEVAKLDEIKDNVASESVKPMDKLKKILKVKEKSFLYEKIPFHKLLNNKKLQLPVNIPDPIDVEISCDNNNEQTSTNDNKEQKAEETCSKKVPNTSFLWRTLKDKPDCVYDTIYPAKCAIVEETPAVQETEPAEDDYEMRMNALKEDPSNECVIEAINMLAISDTFNIRNEIALLCPGDDYETFDNVDSDSGKKSYRSKVNCPLPELPEERRGDYGYECCPSSLGYEKIRDKETRNYYYPNYEDNIYDTIKHSDSASNCYESISESPDYKKAAAKIVVPKHISFDQVSNFSQSTVSSDQKTNSIYGQRSIGGFDKTSSLVYGKCPSEITLSDRSDRSEDWEDVSDQDGTTIIFIREKKKHSPTSWSRKVRHQWNDARKLERDSDVFVSSSSIVYLTRPEAEAVDHVLSRVRSDQQDERGSAPLKILILDDARFETQEITILIDSSDGEHIYEPLSHPENLPQKQYDDDTESFESFDSDDSSENYKHADKSKMEIDITHTQLPDPPVSSNIYTLTRLASVAGKKMKQLTHNFTKSTRKKSNDESVKLPTPEFKSLFPLSKNKKNGISSENIDTQPSYQNLAFSGITEDRKIQVSNRSSGIIEPPNTLNLEKSQSNLNSFKSFKSKFKRSTSTSSSNLKLSPGLSPVSNSTFYLDDSNSTNDAESSVCEETQTNVMNASPNSLPQQRIDGEDKKTPNTDVKTNSKTKRFSATRPTVAPPSPPGEDFKKNKKDARIINAASWYAECGLFKSPELIENCKDRSSSTSWYAEIGLYQPSNISTSSGTSSTLSGSGTCSTTTAFSSPSTPTPPLGMFSQECLYQFYNDAKVESVCRDLGNDYDLFEVNEDTNEANRDTTMPIQRPSAMSFINPKKGPSRTLWCEITEVKDSIIFATLSSKQKDLQEAKFEILTSEASYLNSLNVFESQYINNVAFQDESFLSKVDKQILFGNILPVKRCSERLMVHLETCWQESILLHGLCKIIKEHAEKYFDVYIKFCENQIHLVKTMRKLKSDIKFNKIVENIQSQPACQSLSLDSFLMVPMQRVTRYPLLIEAVLKRLDEASDDYQMCVDTLIVLNKAVSSCNEGARNMERLEQMFSIYSQIGFPSHIKPIPILSVNEQTKKNMTDRWLIRSGELVQLVWRGDDQSKMTFGRKISKTPLHLFLFTDLLIVTKKKSINGNYTVVDYCARSLVEITLSDMLAQPMKEVSGKFVLLLTMLENHEKKTVEMLLSCANETDRQRWMEAFSPPASNSNEVIYEEWDCPQVVARFQYESQQPDELTLYPGDIMNVKKKTAEGWYQGERIRDGECGWFPGNHTAEVASRHVRAKNLKQRYRLLELAGSYLGKRRNH